MTLSQIQQKIYNLTNSDVNTYTNAQMLVDINNWYQHVVMVILRSRDDWEFDDSNQNSSALNPTQSNGLPIFTSDLVANQQDYSLPVSTIKIQRLEISYDGVTAYKAEPIDIQMISKGTQQTQIQQWANTNRPYYDIRYGSIFLYPVPIQSTSNSSGLKMWVSRNIIEFTSSDLSTGTVSPGFDAPFHQVIAYGAASDRAISKNLANAGKINDRLEELLQELSTFYGNKDEDMSYSIQPAYQDYGQLNYQTGNIRRIR